MKIEDQRVVSIHYKLTNEAGEQLDASPTDEPMVYLHGAQNIIEGLEKALAGKAVGDTFKVSVQPNEAYGEKEDGLVESVPKEAFGGIDKIEAGMQFQAQAADGHMQVVTIVEVKEDTVMIDANHPLAGKVLNFEGSVVDIREASAEELEHKHVHGEGGHHH